MGSGASNGSGNGGSVRLKRSEAARVLKLRADFPKEELLTLFAELDIGDDDQEPQ